MNNYLSLTYYLTKKLLGEKKNELKKLDFITERY